MERNETHHSLRLTNYDNDQESRTNDQSFRGMEDHENQETQETQPQGIIRIGTLQPGRTAHDNYPQPQNRQTLSYFAQPFRPQHSASDPYIEYRFQSELNSLASQMQQMRPLEQTQINLPPGYYPRIQTPQPVLTLPNHLCPGCLQERLGAVDAGSSHQFARLGSSSEGGGSSSSSRQVPRLTPGGVETSRHHHVPFPNSDYDDDPGQLQPRFSDNQLQPRQFLNLAVPTHPAVAGAYNPRPTAPLRMSDRPPVELSQSQQLEARFDEFDRLYEEIEALVTGFEERGDPNAIQTLYDTVRWLRQEFESQHGIGNPPSRSWPANHLGSSVN